MSIEIGKKAPAFSAEINGGDKISLKDFAGKWVVLYFYPKDNTSGCTKEACSFRDNMEVLAAKDVVVLGVSPDSVKSHDNFIKKHDLNFNIISDPDKKICEKYGVWIEKKMYGRTYMGVSRSTFIIDDKGKIQAEWRKVKVTGHVEAVLEKLKELI